jgi:hypothetical protein
MHACLSRICSRYHPTITPLSHNLQQTASIFMSDPNASSIEPPSVQSLSVKEGSEMSGDNKPQGLAQEQHVDPWTVTAARDADGKALDFDYVAISK